MHSFKTAVYGFETFVTYTLYGNFGSEVRMILKVTFDLQKYTQNNDWLGNYRFKMHINI